MKPTVGRKYQLKRRGYLMIKTLDIVRGAVATKDLIPVLTHFHIYEGRIQGNNGKLCIDAPFDLDFDVTVPADKFYRAIKMCGKGITMKITPTGKFSMTCGKFRALLNMMPHDKYPRMEIETEKLLNCEGIVPVLKKLKPFISEDASRQWSQAVLIKNGYAYATNNIIVGRVKVPYKWEGVIPALAVNELIRIDKQPTGMNIQENYVSFMYADNIWIRATTCAVPWPDIDRVVQVTPALQLPPYFVETLEKLVPFCDDPKYPFFTLGKDGIRTDTEETGASIDLRAFPDSKFRAEPLLKVARVAKGIAFDSYPKPCYFIGEDIDGAIVGVL